MTVDEPVTLDLDALTTIADADLLTEGRWALEPCLAMDESGVYELATVTAPDDDPEDARVTVVTAELLPVDALFIATFDPPTVRAMLTALREAREQIGDLQLVAKKARTAVRQTRLERDHAQQMDAENLKHLGNAEAERDRLAARVQSLSEQLTRSHGVARPKRPSKKIDDIRG